MTQEHDARILRILKRVLFRVGGDHRFRPAFLGARKVRQLQRTLVGRNPSLDRGINDHSSNDRARRRDGEMVALPEQRAGASYLVPTATSRRRHRVKAVNEVSMRKRNDAVATHCDVNEENTFKLPF